MTMSSTVRAIVDRALILTAAGVLCLGALPAAAASTLDELIDLQVRAWNGEPELLTQVYAPDAVHTATFYDRTKEYTGPSEIAPLTGYGGIELAGPRIDIPAPEGEWRWAGFVTLAGGSACLFRAVDGLITRHDCVLPERSDGSSPSAGLADAATSAKIDAIQEGLRSSWGAGTTVGRLAAVYAPDAVHSARYLNTTRIFTGPEEIIRVAGVGGSVGQIGERVDFDTPAGELAWASVADVAGGSVCLFHAVDGLVTRHDCVLPIAG
jgi:hypothetical protein